MSPGGRPTPLPEPHRFGSTVIAGLALLGILLHLVLRFAFGTSVEVYRVPLWITLALGLPLLRDLL